MATKRKTSKKKPSALACKRRGRALAKKRTASAGKSLAACRRPAKRKSTRNGGYSPSEIDYLNEQFSADNVRRRDRERAAAVPALSQWRAYRGGIYELKLPMDVFYTIEPVSFVRGAHAGYTLMTSRGMGSTYVGGGDVRGNVYSTPEKAVLAARAHYRDNP